MCVGFLDYCYYLVMHLLYRVNVQSKPLDIVYNPSTISRLKQFLATPHGGRGTVDKLSQQIQHHTTAGLRNKLEDILEGDYRVSYDVAT